MSWAVGSPTAAFAVGTAAVESIGVAYGAVAGFFGVIYAVGAFTVAVPSAVVAILGPIIATTFGVQALTNVGVNVLASLIGYGAKYPKCCCPDDPQASSATTRACAVVSSVTEEAKGQCPAGWSHDASQCSVPEVLQYSDEQTMAGCQCKNFTECSTNK